MNTRPAEEFVKDSLEALAKGITAVKYHYSTMKSRPCLVTLSEDLSILKWDYWGARRLLPFSKRKCKV